MHRGASGSFVEGSFVVVAVAEVADIVDVLVDVEDVDVLAVVVVVDFTRHNAVFPSPRIVVSPATATASLK
jgi:hypothetical protein